MRDGVKATRTEIVDLLDLYPELPVLKMGGDGVEDEEAFVLELRSAWLGEWWGYDGRIWDNQEDAEEAYAADNGEPVPGLPHGRCIWIRMDYFDEGEA